MADLEIQKVINNKNEAITELNEFLDNCMIKDSKHLKKTNLLSFWLKDYIRYLDQEETFNSAKLKEYKRGDIIKANLGFNVGNEEGGLHYCVVLDKKNAKSYSTLTVVPLSSLKSISKLNKTSVFLGLAKAKKQVENSTLELEKLKLLPESTEEEKIIKDFKIEQIAAKVDENSNMLDMYEKIDAELNQMKTGTIALVNQLTTISKQRIYNPKKDFDILSGIQLSDDSMKKIDEKIKQLFINN